MPTRVEIAWAAGLFEGEGTITHTTARNNTTGKAHRLSLESADLDVLERFVRVVGVGEAKLVRRTPRPGRKPTWVWKVDGRRRCEPVLRLLLPHLGRRRAERAREALEEMSRMRPDRLPMEMRRAA